MITGTCVLSVWVQSSHFSNIHTTAEPDSPYKRSHSCRCRPDERPDVHPNCTTEEEKQYKSQCSEVILSDRFKPCHSVVSPDGFLYNCVYDMCEYDGMQKTLCDNVEAYAQACKSAGVTISWRNSTFCRELQQPTDTVNKTARFKFYSPH